MTKELQYTQKLLSAAFAVAVFVVILVISLFELDVLQSGSLFDATPEGNHQCFVVSTVMVFVTIIFLPLALRLFRFKKVAATLVNNPSALLRLGFLRMTMVFLPLVADVYLYYAYAFNVAFAYMAIIHGISVVFILPYKDRCEQETTPLD